MIISGLSSFFFFVSLALSNIYNPGLFFPGTAAVSASSADHLEGDMTRFQRMSSVDSFNQVCLCCIIYKMEDLRILNQISFVYIIRFIFQLFKFGKQFFFFFLIVFKAEMKLMLELKNLLILWRLIFIVKL